MDEFDPVTEQNRRIAARRGRAGRALASRRARSRALPPAVVGLSVLAVTGAATAWVGQRLASTPALPATTGSTPDARLAADAAALRAIAAALAADNRSIAALHTQLAGTAAGSPALTMPSLPSISVPSLPPVHAVTGASGAVVP